MTAKNYVFLRNSVAPELSKNDVGFIENENGNTCDVFFLRVGKLYTVEKSIVVEFDIATTGDRFKFKVCDRCYKHLETETHFSNNRLKKDNIITKRPSCKACRKIKDGVAVPAKQRAEWEVNRPVDGSLFSCPICQKKTIVGISKVVLDHNHSTGNVRGWLCESCNTGIGRFDDKIDIIQNAIDWLKRTNR